MMAAWLVVLLTLGAVFAAALTVILFSPLTVHTDFSVKPGDRRGTLFFSWIHPFVARATWSAGDGRADVRIFGRRWGKRAAQAGTGKRKSGESAATPVDHPPVVSHDLPAGHVPSAKEPPPRAAAGPEPEKSADAAGTDAGVKQTAVPPSVRARPVRRRIAAFFHKVCTVGQVLRRHRMVTKAYRWCRRILFMVFRIVRFDHFRISVRTGMDDPARLGKIYGWYMAGNRLLFGMKKKVDIRFEPRFNDRDLALDGSIGLRTSVARVLTPAFVALLTFPWLSAFLVWWRLRKVYKSAPQSDTITGAV
ncbi:MAG: hypothetical protein JXA71_04360 [Chitinispirillaceae bacterium]|nr:hypothetical protein [Chitinispirillaceae bacterium]